MQMLEIMRRAWGAVMDRVWLQALLVFALAASWFSFLMCWSGFPDPDAFYHAKVSDLIWTHGPLQDFPWLDLTTVGQRFADQHFLFHVAEAPFVHVLGWAAGARVSAVFFAAMCAATLFLCLRAIPVRWPAVWVVFFATNTSVIHRYLLGKATPFTLAMFAAAMTLVWKRKPLFLFVLMVFYALAYGGWILFLTTIGMMAIGEAMYAYGVEDRGWKDIVRGTYWREFLAACGGIVVGIALHPNTHNLLALLWVQVVKIGVLTPWSHVNLGMEWMPAEILPLVASFAIWIIVFLIGIAGFLSARRPGLDKATARAIIVFAIPVAFFLALTLKSRRNSEYLGLVVAFWLSAVWNLIDASVLWAKATTALPKRYAGVLPAVYILASLLVVGRMSWMARVSFGQYAYSDHAFEHAMSAIQARLQPGDRIFHSDWDDFPKLFLIEDRARYVSGLDPTFLYEASPDISDAMRSLTWSAATSTKEEAWSLIHDRLASRFVFTDIKGHAKFLNILKSDPRYRLLREDGEAAVFEVVP